MKRLSVAACMFVALGSLEACVAATHEGEGDSGSPPGKPAPDAGSRPDAEAGTAPDGGGVIHVVEAGMPDSGPSHEGGSHTDEGGSHTEAGKASDGAPAADSAPAPTDAGPTCPMGQSLCGSSCVDTMTDPDHCGGCTIACPGVSDGTAACSGGSCGFTCDTAYHACGGVCDSNASTSSCGASCTPCAPPANSVPTCDGTSCGFTCDSGYHACSAACDSNTSVLSCGTSCTACPVPVNGTATCDGTSCGVTCNAGTVLCAGGTACCSVNVIAGSDETTCWLGYLVSHPNQPRCWGRGTEGEIGNGAMSDESYPTAVSGTTSFVSVVAGQQHACGVSTAGAVYCWGDNLDGDVGDGTTTPRDAPVAVTSLSSTVIAITAGFEHTCALAATGAVYCWGYNVSGQLGDGTEIERTSPVAVTGLANVVGISAGGSHTCAVTADGAVWCWGDNGKGELGVSPPSSGSLVPVQATGVSGMVAVVAGSQYTCALSNAGGVECWGDGLEGQLGNGSILSSSTAVSVSSSFGGFAVTALAAASYASHTCALTSAGSVYCWGLNSSGQLGDGTTTNRSTPVEVELLTGVTAIGTGDSHSCALGTGAFCWGSDTGGQLGTTSTSNSSVPEMVE
jgi:alpha-tubulin suppressor-like RCC1 family protein